MSDKMLFKRGDTFLVDSVVKIGGVVQDITNWEILSQVRDGNTLVAQLTVLRVDDIAGRYQLRYDQTQDWSGILSWDIQYTMEDGRIISTRTITLDCRQDISR